MTVFPERWMLLEEAACLHAKRIDDLFRKPKDGEILCRKGMPVTADPSRTRRVVFRRFVEMRLDVSRIVCTLHIHATLIERLYLCF